MLPATRSILYEVGFAAGFCNLRIRATFTLTQEFLSHMLGVRRNTVSVEAHALQQAGLVRYTRGHIKILDRAPPAATRPPRRRAA
jgi:CRP-like cAMP-binding protein